MGRVLLQLFDHEEVSPLMTSLVASTLDCGGAPEPHTTSSFAQFASTGTFTKLRIFSHAKHGEGLRSAHEAASTCAAALQNIRGRIPYASKLAKETSLKPTTEHDPEPNS